MCGIVGMVVSDVLDDDDRAEVAALTDLMVRRGPDDWGLWHDARHCALGFRRLAIQDLSSRGHQPMVGAAGRDVLVFNGEVYNFRELRRELEGEGRTFLSAGDSEVVLQSLAHWGTRALERFNGMFALAWYRPETKRLVLARDPVGIKPLAWWWSPSAFVFGSQYDQVVRHRRCRRDRVDEAALQTYLRLGYLPGDMGIVADTGQVLPGHFLELTPGAAPKQVPYRLMRPIEQAVPSSGRLADDDADAAVSDAVQAAVVRQAVSDVPVGTFLSGGVDSPLVTACLRSGSAGPFPAFTISTDDEATDESAAAGVYADILDVDHRVRTIRGDDAVGLVDDVAAANSEPFGDYSSFPTLLVSELASRDVKVVQSGDGGDELFWGYPRFSKVRHARSWFDVPRAIRAGAYGASKMLGPARRPARGILFPSIGAWYLDAHSGLRDWDLDRVMPGWMAQPVAGGLFALTGRIDDDSLMQWMRRNELMCHLPMVLQKVDRAAMHHSLEVRVPLLDLEVVDLAARISPDACVEGSTGKVVLRSALARRVPREQIPLPKRGFTVPMARWLRTDLRPMVLDLLVGDDPFPGGRFDPRGTAEWLDLHLSGRQDLTRGIWNLLALQLWSRTHLTAVSPRTDREAVARWHVD